MQATLPALPRCSFAGHLSAAGLRTDAAGRAACVIIGLYLNLKSMIKICAFCLLLFASNEFLGEKKSSYF